MNEGRRMYRNLPPCPYCGGQMIPDTQTFFCAAKHMLICASCSSFSPVSYVSRADAILKYYNQHPFRTSTEIRREYRQKKAREK